MEANTMYRDMKLISPHKPKPTRGPTRGDYNTIAHAKSSNKVRLLNFGRFNLRDKYYLGFRGIDHLAKVTHFWTIKILSHTLTIVSQSPHAAFGAL
jgi:hypothetical protein